ncbi:MAG: alpha/beta fold hydrolase [Steroidobacteraceae bacterium]
MNAAASSAPPAVPGFFGPADRPLFGWVHPAASASRELGVVVCGPLGYEYLCCHRTLRRIAEMAAEQGLPSIRFDYDGTWDSAGDDLDPGRVAAWASSVEAAIDALRAATGAERVCVVGIRFGATLAALVAQRRSDVAGIVAIAPVVDGRRYVRELRALAATAATDPTAASEEYQEAAGLTTTAETRDAISALGPAALLPASGMRILILERDDLPADERWPGLLTDAGCVVARERFAGYVPMMLDAHDAKVPHAALERVLHWIVDLAGDIAPRAGDGSSRQDPRSAMRARSALPGRLSEELLQPGGEPRGFAIATVGGSPSGGRGRPLLMLLNSGAVHHVGPYRLCVDLARRLAAGGITVVRFDLPAIGDGDSDPGRIDDAPYPATAVDDIHRTLADLVTRYAPSELHFGGVCAGAYHSLKAAQAGLAVKGIVVVNPLTFFWKPGLPLDAREFQVTAEAARYQRTLFEPAAWLKLLRGQVAIGPIARTFGRRLSARLHHLLRDLRRALGQRLEDDLASELRTIARRGTRIEFVFAENEPGLAMLREQGGRTVGRLERRGILAIETIDGADHTFSARVARERLTAMFERRIRGPGPRAS